MLVYIHGFNSSGRSAKGRMLVDYFAAADRLGEVWCPDLPHRPAQAMAMLEERLAHHAPADIRLVGSSLGGFYATVLAERMGVRAALVNPAVHPARLLEAALGEQQNYHSGERYAFTRDHLRELAALEPSPLQHPERLLLLVETGDEVLDYREALAYYDACRQIVVPGGDHGFRSFARYIPEIMTF